MEVVLAVLGLPFKKCAPFSRDEWQALSKLEKFAAERSLTVLWRTPISRIIPDKPIAKDAKNVFFRSISTAVLIGNPPYAPVRAVVFDSRSPWCESTVELFAENRIPYVLWRGPDRIERTLSELADVLAGEVPAQANKLLSHPETNALHVLRHAFKRHPWSAFDFYPSAVDIRGKMESLAETQNPNNLPTAHSEPTIVAEMALTAVVDETEDRQNRYASVSESAATSMKAFRGHLAKTSLDFVIFPDGLSKLPLFALEVDDKIHDTESQQTKDRLKDCICEFASIPLIRVKTDAIPLVADHDIREASEAIASAVTLLPILIRILSDHLATDRETFEPRRIEIAQMERTAFLRILETKGLGPDQLDSYLEEMVSIRRAVGRRFEDAWTEYHHDAKNWVAMCEPALAPRSAEQRTKNVEEWKLIGEILGDKLPFAEPSPMSYILGLAHHHLVGEIQERGWKLGDIRFQGSEAGSRATVDMTRVRDGKVSTLASRLLKLSGVSSHIDFRCIEIEVAALYVMYEARNLSKIGK